MHVLTKQSSLVQLVISSTFFYTLAINVSTTAYAAGPTTVSTLVIVPPTYDTTTKGNITISTTGAIQGTTDAITVNSDTATIVIDANNAGSLKPNAISTTGGVGSGILVDATGTNATIQIGAKSNVTSDFHAVNINSTSGINLTNQGSLLVTGTSSAVEATTVMNMGINNSGTISGLSALADAINISGGSGAAINNTGNINATTGNAISLSNATMALNITNGQAGTISTTASDVIKASAGVSLNGGLVNSGNITASPGFNAINFGATTNSIVITNNAPGTITGNVIVSSNAAPGTVLNMNGGTIDGTVKALVAAGARTFKVTSGTITGGIDLSASTQADSILQSGGTIGNILGNTGVGQSLIISAPVITGGTITNIDNITVTNPGIFRVENSISNAVNLALQGASLINNNTISATNTVLTSSGGQDSYLLNNGILTGNNLSIATDNTFQAATSGSATFSGALTNNGNLILEPHSYPNPNITTGTFTQFPSGKIQTQITDKNNFGQIKVNGGATINGALQVVLTGEGFVENGDQFVVVDGTGVIGGSVSIGQPVSQTLKFAQIVDPGNITLQASRIATFSSLADSVLTQGPAAVLDSFLPNPTDPDIRLLIGALDAQANVNPGLLSLLPAFDGGQIQLTHDMQKHVFDDIGRYLDEHRPLASLIPGYVAGDLGLGRGCDLIYSRGTWAKVWGSRATQKNQGLSDGYELSSTGVVFGYDQYCSDRVILGGALSYATGTDEARSFVGTEQTVDSFQITAYSTYDYSGPGYLDVMLGLGFNQYDSNRHIIVGPFIREAIADYTGWIYGVNLESGYRFSYGKYRIIPVGKLKYSYLKLDNYTETGAGGIGLSVHNGPIEEGVTAIGIKLNATNRYAQAIYVPEFRFNIIYDWINDGALMTSDFIAGGPAFITAGVTPHPCTYNFGFSLSILALESTIGVLSYDLDLRPAFAEHTVGLKIRYEW